MINIKHTTIRRKRRWLTSAIALTLLFTVGAMETETDTDQPEVTITYFESDEKKKGGAYITANGLIKKINEYDRVIVMTDGTLIPIDEIISIDGQIFESMFDL